MNVLVSVAHAYVSIDESRPLPIRFEQQPVAAEEAHALMNGGPIVNVEAVAWVWGRCGPEEPTLSEHESAWSVTVAGFIEHDTNEAMDAGLAALRADIQAGRIAPGTHVGLQDRNPLYPLGCLLFDFHRQFMTQLGWAL